jgi:autotransporter-associated beta strand protein
MNASIWGRWVARLFHKRRPARRPQPVQRLSVEPLEDRVTPTQFIWTGGGGNAFWSNPANWQGGVAPTSAALPDLVFGGDAPTNRRTTNNNIPNLAVTSVLIADSGYVLSGSKVLLGGNLTVGSGAGSQTVSLDVQLTADSSFTINNVADLTLSGHLSGSGSGGASPPTLSKKGVGTMRLTNDNSSYAGTIEIDAGRMIITNVNALGATSANTVVEANAQLQVSGIVAPINEPLIVNGPGINNDGALLNLVGNSTWAGTITMDSNASLGANAGTTMTVSGLIDDTGFTGGRNLTKVGAGTIVFSRVGGNTYRGQTIINNGILRIQDPLSLGAGADATQPQNGDPNSGTVVNSNATTGEAGTLQLNFVGLGANDPNGILQNPALPFNPTTNPYVGFQVFNDRLTLNGSGFNPTGFFSAELGALSNLNGENVWSGGVTLGSPPPNTGAVSIGVEGASELILSGVVSDPNRTPELIKISPGRLVLSNANTYDGNTIVREGVLNIRDSRALGTDGAGVVTVESGAVLELEVDSGLAGTADRTDGRNLGYDSVRGSGPDQEVVVTGTSGTFTLTFDGETTAALPFNVSASDLQNALNALTSIGGVGGNVTVTQSGNIYRITFGGTLGSVNIPLLEVAPSSSATAVVNAVYGLTVAKPIQVIGLSDSFSGALRSISGINRLTGTVTIGDLFNPIGSIAVDADARPGHPSVDDSYFTRDHSLTIVTPNALQSLRVSAFSKFGAGHLILPETNTSFLGSIRIAEGWITVQDNLALGPVVADQSKGETMQPNFVKVETGASLHLRPNTPGENLTLANRLQLLGRGITHPFAMLEQGAVLSLGGNNVLTGDIGLASTLGSGVAIGVDDPNPSNPESASTLTTKGTISDFVANVLNLSFTAGGFEPEQRFPIDTGSTSGTIIIASYNFYFVPDQLRIYYPPRAQGGTLIFDTGLISDPPTGNPPPITVNYGPGPSTFIEIVMNEGGGQPGTAWDLFDVQIIPNAPPGGNGLFKLGSRRLELQGDGTFTGDVNVVAGTLRVQNDSALGRDGSGTAVDGVQTFTTSTTTVAPGALLELEKGIAPNNGGIAAGVQVWDERLVLNGAGQQVSVSGNAGTFTLSFNGASTGNLAFDVTAAQMQAALSALSTIGGVGGTVTVTKADHVYTVTFGGSLAGLNNPLMVAIAGPAPGNMTVEVTGTNFPLSALPDADIMWRGPITLAADTTIDVGDQARLILYGPISDATNPEADGSSLTVNQVGSGNTGELVLAGNNTYRGTTFVKQGILTIANSNALGGIGGAEVQEVTALGSFTLNFDGQSTGPLTGATTAAQMETALNALSTVGGAGGSVTVTKSGNVFTITFGGGVLAGADQPQLVATGAATVATQTNGFGGTVVSNGAQMQIQGSLAVAGESLTLEGTGVGPGDVPTSIPQRWYTIGPGPINGAQTAGDQASTGRVTGVAVDPSDPNVIYVSTAGGGAWKTKNGGRTWTPLFDSTPASSSEALFSGAIAIAPSDPRVIYLGTGEANNSGDSYYGTGVYKSTDSGRTWTLLTSAAGTPNPLNGTAVSRIVVEPTNPNIVYVATSDLAVNGPSGNAGVWRHSAGSWVNLTAVVSSIRQGILPANSNGFPATAPNTPGPDDDWRISFASTSNSFSDLQFGFSRNRNGALQPTLFAAQGDPVGDRDNAVFRLLNPALAGSPATTNWFVGNGNPLNAQGGHDYSQGGANPFPAGDFAGNPLYGNIKFTATPGSPTTPSTLYAATTFPNTPAFTPAWAQFRQIFRSTDGGHTWAATAAQPPNYQARQGDYDSTIVVSPANPNVVYVGGAVNAGGVAQQVFVTTNGGATWTDISVDIDGNGPHTDGHAMQVDSQDRLIYGNDGGVWRFDPADGKWTDLNGGGLAITTFNSVASHPTNPNIILGGSQDNGTERFTGNQAWTWVDAGDGGVVRFDPNNPNIAYHVLNGTLRKSTDGGVTWTNTGFPPIGGLYFPFVVDSINSSRLVAGRSFVEESLDGGATWTNLFDILPGTITAVAISTYQGNLPDGTYQVDPDFLLVTDKGANTYDPDTIYATDGFNFAVTKNHAQSWVMRTAGLGSGFIQDIMVDPRNRDTVYVVQQGLPGSGENQVFQSTDAGQTWINITGTQLPDVPFWKIVIDPRDGTLYLGTDTGVWSLPNGTGSWARFGVGMPNVQVTDLDLNLNLNTITAATYGRSAFQFFLDDVQANSGALRATSGLSTWTGPVRLAGPTTITVGGNQALPNGASAATLDISGIISDRAAGNFALTKEGEGTLVFSGANQYGGVTDVAEGVLVVNNPEALGDVRPGGNIVAQGGTVVDAGAALHLQTNLEEEPIVLNGHGVAPGFNGHNSGALRNVSGTNTYTGTLTLNTDATIGVDSGSQLTIGTSPILNGTGTIQGSSDLTKELTGTLVLGSNNTGFTGGTDVFQGAVRLEHSGALGTGTAGARVLDGAQIQLRTPTTGPSADQPVVVNAPLTLSGTGIFGTGALLNAGGNNTWAGAITFDALPGFAPVTFPFGDVLINVPNSADTLTIGGTIGQAAGVPTGLTKIGAGKLVLTQDSTYSGATEVEQGTLNIRDADALGLRTGTASVQRIVTISPATTGTFTLTFNGASTTLAWGATNLDVQVALNGLSTIASVGGSVVVTRTEIQTTTQAGPGNPETGFLYTVVFGGALATTTIPLTASGADGTGASASVVATGGIDVRVASGAALELDTTGTPSSGFTVLDHLLTVSGSGVGGNGALRNVAGNNTWEGLVDLIANASVGVEAATSLTLSGGVDAAGLDLTKVRPGTLIFPDDPDANTQLRTVINAGTVQVDGTIGNVRLAGGTLSGTGNVTNITSTTGGTVNPGDNFPTDQTGTLDATGATLNSTNTFFVNLNNSSVPTHDLLQLNGSINLGNATLAGTVATNVALGNQFTIIQTTGGGTVNGVFAGQSTTPTPGALRATIAYIDNQRFLVDYYTDHVTITRQLANLTSMTLAPSIASPVYGQRETFVVTFVPESPTLTVTGTVEFFITSAGSTFQFSIPIDGATNTATFDPSAAFPNGFGGPLGLGVYDVRATYNGLDQFGVPTFNPATATPDPVTVTVTAAGTTTTLSASQSPSAFGQSVTFTARVATTVSSPVAGTQPPEGSVQFFRAGNIFLGTGTLIPDASGNFSTATFTTSSLAVGTHNITAVYQGDGIPALSHTVNKATPVVDLGSAPNPSNYGQQVTLTASVTAPSGTTGTPTGTVTFLLGSTTLGTATLAGGVATFTTSPFQLPGGANQTITAVYNGDTNYNIASDTVSQTVNPSSSSTSVVASVNPSAFGQSVTFTATITPGTPGGAAPTGTVTFFVNGTPIGSPVAVSGGTAVISTNSLPQGTHTISAQYSGDTNYTGSTGTVSHTVNQSGTTTTVTAAPTTAVATRAITFTATVRALSPSTGIPTGQVKFTDTRTNIILGTVTLDSNGVATLQAFLGNPLGNHTVRAEYLGDGDYAISQGQVAVNIVANGTRTSTVALASTANPSVTGRPVTFVATVRDTGALPRVTPNGTVAFYDGATLLGFGTLTPIAAGVARATFTTALTISGTTAETHTIVARYSGSPTFARSNSAALNQIVKPVPTRTSFTVLAQSSSTSVFGQPVTFTATVTDTGGGGLTPTGTVTFTDTTTSTVLGTATLTPQASGVARATFTTNALALGAHQVTATYSGDTDFAPGSPSSPVTHTVSQASSTTTVTSSANPSKFGQIVTFTVRVAGAAPSTGAASGSVRIFLDGADMGLFALNASGVATFATAGLTVGTHTVRAEYQGSAGFAPSVSTTLTQTVSQSATTATLSRSTANANQSVTFTARVLPVAPGAGLPTGSVTFVIDGVVRGTVGLVNGVARLTLPSGLSVGTHNIRVVYSGDANFLACNPNFSFNFVSGRGT